MRDDRNAGRKGQIAVIFASRRNAADADGYAVAAAAMDALAAEQPGYRGVDATRGDEGFGITVSYWADDATAIAWRDHPQHVAIRERGRAVWYDGHTISVARVERAYDWTRSMTTAIQKFDRKFALMFLVMLTIAAGNTALQSVLPALGRSLGVADSAVAAAFSVSALLWVIAAPFWAKRSDRHGRRAMILLGVGGFSISLVVCGIFLLAGINGWIGGTAAFGCFIAGRLIYGTFGAAAPPAVQALVAGETTRAERTKALTLLASAFGLGTILGPAIAPYLILGSIGGTIIGLSGPAFLFAAFGVGVWITVRRMLVDDRIVAPHDTHGASSSYPSIGGEPTGASVTAATESHSEQVGYGDRRIRAWMIAGLVMGHAQAMTGQAIGFLVIDRLHLAPALALEPTGIVLMMGAGAALLAQWGIIPRLNLTPKQLVLIGLVIAAVGTAATGLATSLYGIATAYALASLGFGFTRPGFTAGSSLAVGANAQGSVAGKVTSINGASFVLGPSIGVGLYEFQHSLPYLVAGAACVLMFAYAWVGLRDR